MIKDAHCGCIGARDVDCTHVKEFGNWFERRVGFKYNTHSFHIYLVMVVRN